MEILRFLCLSLIKALRLLTRKSFASMPQRLMQRNFPMNQAYGTAPSMTSLKWVKSNHQVFQVISLYLSMRHLNSSSSYTSALIKFFYWTTPSAYSRKQIKLFAWVGLLADLRVKTKSKTWSTAISLLNASSTTKSMKSQVDYYSPKD